MRISGVGLVFDKSRKDKVILKDIRRADDLIKMAVLAAYDAFIDSGLKDDAKNSLGVILATAFGPHVTTFRFLDEILDYGDANVSPTLFSHSVHNAANSYISSNLSIYGPTITLTNFNASFYQALLVAQSWLNEDRCENILVGSVEQYGKEMAYILSGGAPEFSFREGSAFLLVSKNKSVREYCSVSALVCEDKMDGYILEGLGAGGFACAKAATMLKEQVVKENKIYCLGKNINGEELAIELKK